MLLYKNEDFLGKWMILTYVYKFSWMFIFTLVWWVGELAFAFYGLMMSFAFYGSVGSSDYGAGHLM